MATHARHMSPAEAVLAEQAGEAIQSLARRYSFRRPEEVDDYLREHPHLVSLLLAAADVVPRYFGADAPLVLEVFTDPEGSGDDRELFASIQTTLGPRESLDRLDRFEEDWWFDVSQPGPGVVVFDVEPI